MVQIHHLSSYIISFKTTNIFPTTTDSFLTAFCTSYDLKDGTSHSLIIVRRNIQAVRASGLLKTGTCTSYYRQPTADSLYYRNAKTLIYRRIYEHLSLGIKCWKMVVRNIMQKEHTMIEAVGRDIFKHFVGVTRLTPYNDQ